MRLKPGRPDLAQHADLFDVPPAGDHPPVAVTFLGVSTLYFDAGDSAIAALNGGYHVAFLIGALFAVAAVAVGVALLRPSAAMAPHGAPEAAAAGAGGGD